MTGDHAPVHTVPAAVAVPAPRRPAPPAVWTFVSSGSPDGRDEEAATEQQPQVRVTAGAAPGSALNRRDLEVLFCLSQGRSTTQIASSLSVSRNTARTRIRRLQRKLDVAGRDAVIRVAQDLGVLAIRPRLSPYG
jgi:DNA-binding CsgD family transcriptional regulator